MIVISRDNIPQSLRLHLVYSDASGKSHSGMLQHVPCSIMRDKWYTLELEAQGQQWMAPNGKFLLSGVKVVIERRFGNRVMGFGAPVNNDHKLASLNRSAILQNVEPEDLLSYGFIPEFIGRLPMVTLLEELNESQLVSILTEPKNALTKQYAKLLAMEGVQLEFVPDALDALAALAVKKGTGARALRGILEKLMLDVMYEIPGNEDILSVIITRPVVLEESKPYPPQAGPGGCVAAPLRPLRGRGLPAWNTGAARPWAW